MPEKVIHGGRLIPGAAEVEVPSWAEFDAAIFKLSQRLDLVCQEFASSNENKQALWDAVNQFKRDPAGDIHSEFRALRDAAFSAQTQINGPQPGGEWTIWQCIGNHGERFDAIDRKFRELPDMVKETLRDVLVSQLKPLLNAASANIDGLLKDNCDLKTTASSLSKALGGHGERLETLEKQIRELPDKARAVLLGNILAELQPQLDSAKADIASLQSANDELKNGIDSLHTELSSCQTNLKQGLASSQEANSSLKQEINSFRSELSSCQTGLKQELASAQEANSKLKAEIDSLRTELSTCQTGLKQELASTQEANSKLETEIASLHTELSTCQANLKQEVTSSLEASTRLEAEINSLRAELSTCQANLDAHLNPPKKQGFFKRLYFRMLKFFRSKTFSDTNTPPPQGS